jgi:hypothetical protein
MANSRKYLFYCFLVLKEIYHNMDEIKTGGQDSRLSGQTPPASKETTPTKTYTEKELRDAVAATGAEWGRKYKTLETEHKTLKEQHLNLSTELDGLKASAKEIEDAGGDAAELQKRIKELTKREKLAQAKELTLAEKDKLNQESDLSVNATIIAAEFQENDPERLIKLCKKANIKFDDEAGIREIAEDLGWKPVAKEETKEPESPLVTDSGATSGGGVNIDKMSPGEKIAYGLEQAKKKK